MVKYYKDCTYIEILNKNIKMRNLYSKITNYLLNFQHKIILIYYFFSELKKKTDKIYLQK